MKYFKEKEYACKGVNCCGGTAVVDNHFANKMDMLREIYGKPINLTNGFRCKKHNKEVGGVANSNHTKGRAFDCYCDDLEDLCRLAKCIFNEVIFYRDKGFVHIGDN